MHTARITLISAINTALYHGSSVPKAERASYLVDAILRYNLTGARLEKYIVAVDNFIAKVEKAF